MSKLSSKTWSIVYKIASMRIWPRSNRQYSWQLLSCILKIHPFFTTSLIFLVIKVSSLRSECVDFMPKKRINLYHHYSVSGRNFIAGGILFRYQAFMPFFLLFLYTLKLGSFCYKLNMVVLDLSNTQSSYKFMPETRIQTLPISEDI